MKARILVLLCALGAALAFATTINFPTALDDTTTLFNLTDNTSMKYVAKFHNTLRDAILALETKVGVTSSADPNSLDFKTRLIRDQGGFVYNMAAYGVKCDGSTDDTAAAQAVVNTAYNGNVGRAHFVFPAGTCLFTGSLKWPKADRRDVVGIGAVIEGAGAGVTHLDYTGSSWLFVLNDGTGSDNIANFTFRDFSVRLHGSARGVFVLYDPTITSVFEELDLDGAGTSGAIGILGHGEISCVCHNTFRNIKFSGFDKNIQLSGFTNANDLQQLESVTTNTAALYFGQIAANAVCGASGQPYACCTGAGTGSSAGACAADTSGGDDNDVIRTEFASGVTLGVRILSGADRNLFEKVVCDGATACVANASTIGTTFVGCVLNPTPTGSGNYNTYNTALGGSTPGVDLAISATNAGVDYKAGGGAASRVLRLRSQTTNPFSLIQNGNGSNGDELRVDAGTGAASFATFYANSAERFRCAGDGGCKIASLAAQTTHTLCITSTGIIGYCASVVDSSGDCTCTTPTTSSSTTSTSTSSTTTST